MVVQNSKGALKFKSCNFARKVACKMHDFIYNIPKVHILLEKSVP